MKCMTNILNKKLAFDTNVLIYAVDDSSPHHRWAVKWIKYCIDHQVEIIITHQVVMEYLNVLIKKLAINKTQALKSVQQLLKKNISIIYPQPSTLILALKLIKKQKATNFFDMYLVATLIDSGINTILTKNKKDFKGVGKLEILD